MSKFEKAEQSQIEAAMAIAAGYDLRLVDEAQPELGWEKVERIAEIMVGELVEPTVPFKVYAGLSASTRHINRYYHGYTRGVHRHSPEPPDLAA